MTNFNVGYKKPPVHTRFKKGMCPNPKGRGKQKPELPSVILQRLRDKPVEVHENGSAKRMSKIEFQVRSLARAALKGDVQSANMLIDLYSASKADEPEWMRYYQSTIEKLNGR